MSFPTINPNHAYTVAAGATAVSWVPMLDTLLHILASLVVIVSGTIAIINYVRKK
jgi:hypothetical protein